MFRVLLTSSVLILAILLLRSVLRGKVGNGFLYALWLLVAVRLLMPVPEFFLERVAGLEKPWVGSTVSVMNLAAGLASYGERDTVGQQEEPDQYSGDDAGNDSVEEQEKPLAKKSEDSPSENGMSGTSSSLKEIEKEPTSQSVQGEKQLEEKESGTTRTEGANSQKPEMTENTGDSGMYEKIGGGGGL